MRTSRRLGRRAFLLLRAAGGPRVMDLSCERLYMRTVDARLPGDVEGPSDGPWEGEPPLVFDRPTRAQVFQDLERELRDVEVVRVVNPAWLASDDLRRDLEAVLHAFHARGGRVEWPRATGRAPDAPPTPAP